MCSCVFRFHFSITWMTNSWMPCMSTWNMFFYVEGIYVALNGDPMYEMLFIVRGELESGTTNGGSTCFFNIGILKPRDFYGNEYLHGLLISNVTTIFLHLFILYMHWQRWMFLPSMPSIWNLWLMNFYICIASNGNTYSSLCNWLSTCDFLLIFLISLSRITTMSIVDKDI